MCTRRSILNASIPILLIAAISAVGCTPEEEQAIREAASSAIDAAISQAIEFGLSFGREALAAFLF